MLVDGTACLNGKNNESVLGDEGQAAEISLVKAPMLRITRRRGRPMTIIWIDDTLSSAAPCRRSALRQRDEVTFDAFPKDAERSISSLD